MLGTLSYWLDGFYMIADHCLVSTERVGAEVVECACVIELPDLKVRALRVIFFY